MFLSPLYNKSGGPDPNTSEDAHITDLAVDPLVRRRLVATNLLSFAKNVAISRGMKRIYLEVGLGNKAAVDMYLKAGYEKLSEDDEDEDHGIRMGLRL